VAGLAAVAQAAAPQSGSADVTGPWWYSLVGLCLLLVQGVALLRLRGNPVPVAMVVVSAFAASAVVATDVPVCAWVAVYGVAAWAGDGRRAAVVVSGAVFAVSVAVAVAGPAHGRDVGLAPFLVVLTVLVATSGGLVRTRRGRSEALERAHAAATQRAAAEERLRIARDLHDLVGHGLATLAVQSSTARLALDAGETAVARDALAAVEAASRATMREMRQLLGVLRRAGTDGDGDRDGDALEPSPGVQDVTRLVDRVRGTGTDVDLRCDVDEDLHADGGLPAVPPAVGLCAYRIVQESLTNAVKHAPGSRIRVQLSVSKGELAVGIVTIPDGRRAAPEDDEAAWPEVANVTDSAHTGSRTGLATASEFDRGAGQGLVGLRERVAAAGGTFSAGPADHGGWQVTARLPGGRDPDRRGPDGEGAE
jgi:signal transduction histidine kinase